MKLLIMKFSPSSCHFISNGNRRFYSRATAKGHETNYPIPCSAEVENAWSYTSTPPSICYDVLGKVYLFLINE
jgi:hypothetical protein